MEKPGRENGTLLLMLIVGFSINGSFAALFNSVVPFSVFPIIALLLAVYYLHQRYLNRAMLNGMPKLAAGFLLGLLLYSAIMRVEHPQIGSNFLPSILCVALVFLIGFKLKVRKALNENAQE
ncbi:YijD family membrane protein [Serratia symbiotica]|uniref:YijD family membrane protein n=1 Tax=Serratia symbiotica TaxID=138074 RepID=UPI0030CCDE58|nr:YijD family membrane protein [Serratia symbiotica]